jgi:uncharacterized beta-barrel protein YwiB (DUF1934 family)
MKNGRLSISTKIDGEEEINSSYDARIILNTLSAEIHYEDGESSSSIFVGAHEVKILRNGEYTLELNLKEGETTISRIGFGGSIGEISTNTEKISYSLTENSVLLSLKYALAFSKEEIQKMKIRLMARIISEEK